MSVKQTTQARVGHTYGERRQADRARLPEPMQQPAASLGLFRKLRDFFSVDPKIAASHFFADAKFLNGDNVSPYQALTSAGRRPPAMSDEKLLSDIRAILHPPPRPSPVPGSKKA